MSAITTSTCMPRSNARYSACVSATPRREQPLDGRVAGLVEIEDAPRRHARSARTRSMNWSDSRAVMPTPTKTTANGSPCGARAPSTMRAASSSARQPRPGEDRQLLAAHQRVHAVDRRDAGLDEIGGPGAPHRIIGAPQIGRDRVADRRGEPVDRRADAVERAAEQFPAHDGRRPSRSGSLRPGPAASRWCPRAPGSR